uniref:WD repeat-containing protein 88 n=1 Tax=Jaculus jaculus TaxID=51337 RepID=UPI001E1B4572|nr:WD repeat-containing protein 88 [Jaculus jaculus]
MASPPPPGSRMASGEARRGSGGSRRGSAADARKGSVDARKGSVDARKGSTDARKGSVDVRRGSTDIRRGSTDSRRGSTDSRRGSTDARRGSTDSRRGSTDARRGSDAAGRKGSIKSLQESRRESSSSTEASVHGPHRMPWATLVKALGGFKSSLPEIRRDRMLAAYDPLALDKDLEPYDSTISPPEVKVWGDHEPLSKIPYKILSGHEQSVTSCHFCVSDAKLLSGSYDCTVRLWDVFDGTVIREFEPRPKAPVLGCSVTADSTRVVASSYDKTVRVWDLETGQMLWKIRHDTFAVSCKFSPNGKFVVSALDVDRGLCVVDAENITTVIQVKDHHKRSITSCCFDSDSLRVASVSLDKSIKIWDITSQATLLTIPKAHSNAISDCCFTFSGHFLCTSSWDKTLKIWNVHTGEFRNRGACVTLMRGHEGCVSSCSFARDSSFLISGGYDKTVAIWDVGEGYRKLSLKGHDDWVMNVAVSNNKKWILSASKDKTMRLWNIEQIDKIPLVIEYKKSMGLKVKQCKGCDRPFSSFGSDSPSEIFTRCVFCRREGKDIPEDGSSSSEG